MKLLKSILILIIVLVFSDTQSRTSDRVAAFGISVPKTYEVHGIDVSRYQEKIDWCSISKISESKSNISISFTFVKATEGQSLRDRYFNHNWKETKKHNIKRGAYHYYKPNVNSALQVKNFINTVKLEKGDLAPVLDIEELGRYGVKNMQTGVKRWLVAIEKHYGVRPIIYTNISFFKKYLSGNEFKDYPIWLAHYTGKKLNIKRNWVFWQYSDKGIVKNIRSKVAFNVYNGNRKELERLCKQ